MIAEQAGQTPFPELADHPGRPGTTGGPTALRIMLGSQLRRLRESRGISREEAADVLRATHSKISRLELGRTAFKQRDLVDLLDLYGITEESERDALMSLARQASVPGWWHRYNDILPSWLEPYIGLESAASMIRTFEVQFVHGLMQTEDYARAVIRVGNSDASPADIDRRVQMRMTRQRMLAETDRRRVWAVLDEAALHRPYGSRSVLRGQIEHLLEMSTRPNVMLQVLPFSVGAHPGAGGPFTILRFHQSDLPDVVYLEQLSSALYLDKIDEVSGYMRIMDELCILAEDGNGTRDHLHRLLAEL
ncbi:helix-turn-helix domain-containing protein [Actinocorallia longicatena]|uniref:Helix-turn-helix transcriptional regulator n=1 Tax=Actinocorallia longicatena TaxID=111803 RepID=A0ABP6Q8D2_9ACTN